MISIIIPAYNEEKSIGNTIKEIKNVIKNNKILDKSEIIVIDDGSNDNTYEEAKKQKITVLRNPHNMGYGYSLKKGIMNAKNDVIVITDGDGTYPFSNVIEMINKKNQGFDLVIGARSGKYYRESIFKSICRKLLKRFVEFVSGKKIKDINSGLRVFDKNTVMIFFPVLCNTFSFTTSQTLAYLMNSLFVCYVDIPYNKRVGKTKVKFIKDSLRALKYIIELGVYYNPLKIFTLLSLLCILLSIINFLFSHFLGINACYIIGIGGIFVGIIIFALGLLAVMLKRIINK